MSFFLCTKVTKIVHVIRKYIKFLCRKTAFIRNSAKISIFEKNLKS